MEFNKEFVEIRKVYVSFNQTCNNTLKKYLCKIKT